MQDLTITLVQTSLTWQDPATNRAHFDGLLAQLSAPTDLVVLPEMFTTGFTMDAADHFETMGGETIAWMQLVAKDFDTAVCGSLIIRDDDRFLQSADLDDAHRTRWLLRQTTSVFVWPMSRIISRQAPPAEFFTLNGWRICPLVCYDLRFPVWSRGIDEFDAVLYVANWPAPRKSAWRSLLPARAIENLCYSIGVNRIGTDGTGKPYAGDSVVCDYLGRTLVDCADEEAVLTTTLDGAALLRYRQKFPAHLDADAFALKDSSAE